MIIDFHVHAFPDKVASKAIETLEDIYGAKAFSDGTVTGLLSHMKKSGVDISVIQSVSTAARQVVSINTWVAEQEKQFPLIGFGTIHPEFESYKDEIQRMKELGIKGVKFQPSFQKFFPDDAKMYPIYEELIKAGLIILFHAGDEIRPAPIVYATPDRLAKMLDAMQRDINLYNYRDKSGHIKLVAAHMGSYKMWDQVEKHLIGRDIYFDASFFFGHIEEKEYIRLIRAHGVDKILFASDFPFGHQKKDIQAVMELDLTDAEKERIFSGNASILLDI